MIGVLTLVLLTGCSNDNARTGVAEVSGFETSVTVYPEVVHSYDIIPLELTDDCILTGIRKIAKVDSSYKAELLRNTSGSTRFDVHV